MTDPEFLFRQARDLPGCTSTTTSVPPAGSLEYDAADWAGVVVVVVSGRLCLECRSGEQASFDEGTVLLLAGLDLRLILNPGVTPLVLKRITRRER
ncbi:hypothetical protein [Cryptosporangium sp. NPDC051539]|uniref:hypothetical protein n=1 Tax=Cryptosporangium sp. NPDC051539 TaxID=3363962 RepID=UPI0037A6FA61